MAKVMISLPDELLRAADRAARAQLRSRSELVREALRALLAHEAGTRTRWSEALAPLENLDSRWSGEWDSTRVVREAREKRYGVRRRR